jgi:hypothetical protein
MICPSCRQDAAPIVRGMRTYCTACGAPLPFTAAPEAVNLAGQPAKVGGGIARVLGWLVLGLGTLVTLAMGSLAGAIFAGSTAAYVGGFFGVLTLLVAIPLMLASRTLRKSGESSQLAAREQAVVALAARNRGVLTAPVVARALDISEESADATLTVLAKRPDGRVSLEIDDGGNLTYLFHDLVAAGDPRSRVRIDGEGWRMPTAPSKAAEPRVIDAELVDEEQPPAEAPRRLTR